MTAAWLLSRVRPQALGALVSVARRLTWVTCAVAVIGFLVIFYLYPSADQGFRVLDSVGRKSTRSFDHPGGRGAVPASLRPAGPVPPCISC